MGVSPTPQLSVVVPTFRRPGLLRRCLDALAAQDLPTDRWEVVVVDDGSADETPQVVAAADLAVVGLTLPANRGPATARNRGLDAARAPLVLFLDDDIVAAPALLSTHLALHREAGDPAPAVLGRVDWDPSLKVSPFMRWLDRSGLQFGYATWLRAGPVDPPYAAFYTANLSISRDLVLDAGGFDERFRHAAYEDMELAFRLHARGLTLHYRPQAQAFTARPIDLAGFCGRMQRVAESAQVLREVAPTFPLDDGHLLARVVPRRRRVGYRLGALTGSARMRDRYYWAEVAAAYARGGPSG